MLLRTIPSVVDGLGEGRRLVVRELVVEVVDAAPRAAAAAGADAGAEHRVARGLRVQVAGTGALKKRIAEMSNIVRYVLYADCK